MQAGVGCSPIPFWGAFGYRKRLLRGVSGRGSAALWMRHKEERVWIRICMSFSIPAKTGLGPRMWVCGSRKVSWERGGIRVWVGS